MNYSVWLNENSIISLKKIFVTNCNYAALTNKLLPIPIKIN